MRQRAQRPEHVISNCVGKPCSERRELTLLTAAQLLDPLLLVERLGVERHADADARVVLDGPALRLVLGLVGRVGLLPPVGAALDHEPAVARGHELLEDVGELARHLLERALDGLVLALVQVVDELRDGRLRVGELRPPLEQLLLLRREAVVLLERLLVDVLVLLERVADLLEPRVDLSCVSVPRSIVGRRLEGGWLT